MTVLVLGASVAVGCTVGEESDSDDPSPASPATTPNPPNQDLPGQITFARSKPAPEYPPGPSKPAPEYPPGPSEGMKAAMSGVLPAKPERATVSSTAGDAVASLASVPVLVSASASPYSLWPTQTSTITVTASQDIGPTPYYLRVWDAGAQAYIAVCGTGISCSATVTSSTIQDRWYWAVLDDINHNEPDPDNDEQLVIVDWHGAGVALHESANLVPVGSAVTLTANATYDVTSSPYFIMLYDVTTGTALCNQGYGTSCSATVSQSVATTHQYVACFSDYSASYPPTHMFECTELDPVTWTNSGISVSLTAPATTEGSETVTATSSIDVGPTPYWIEIFDLDTRSSIVTPCGHGTTCQATYDPTVGAHHLVAFVAYNSTALLPPNIQAQSAVVLTTRLSPPPH